jgi:hypothetical protein
MSGGPVLDEQGRLCGLVASGFDGDVKSATWTSFAVLLWPSFDTEIVLPPDREPRSILSLASDRSVAIDGWERVTIAGGKVRLCLPSDDR